MFCPPSRLQVNKAVINMLRYVEPYITWGYPNLKSVRELIYKRGFGKVNKDRIPLTDNTVIEQVRSHSSPPLSLPSPLSAASCPPPLPPDRLLAQVGIKLEARHPNP